MALKDKLPNRALTGPELKKIALVEFERMLDSDYAFQGSVAYRQVAIEIRAVFHLGFPHPVHELQSRVQPNAEGTVAGAPPLNPVPEESSVVGLRREVRLENPNLDRITHGLPIVVQRATPPVANMPDSTLPGESAAIAMQAGFETIEHKYDASTMPETAQPVDTDISQEAAERFGVPVTTGMGLRTKRVKEKADGQGED